MSGAATTAVIMARGLGTRMRHDHDAAGLDEAQRAMAAQGLKGMIPDSRGRPFLDHLLAALADGGITRVVLVVAPEHEVIRAHYREAAPRRVTIEYAVQPLPTGTADAVLAAAPRIGGAPFLVANADNLYPVEAIEALVRLDHAGVAAFDRTALIAGSNIEAERIAAFATLSIDGDGWLTGITEKPAAADPRAVSRWIGMNLWRFDEAILGPCHDVPVSPRGERELPQAVALALRGGMRLRACPVFAGVLDLSRRGDVAAMAAALGAREVAP